MKSRALLFATALAGVLTGLGCGNNAETTTNTDAGGPAVTLLGAGSSFVNPAMSQWAESYKQVRPNVTINYQSVGSGGGISQYQAGTVDFGATDAPLADKDLAGMTTPTTHVPVVAGAVVLAYNVPGVATDLKLSPAAVAGIFLGTVKSWNDPAIAADNAGVNLPNTPITICHRSDGSGTTYIFTNYLAAVSPAWKNGPGVGKSVNWPAGTGGKGNEGVTGLVKQTQGSIGYTELAYAIQTKLPYASLKNAAGEFVKPSVESTTAAVAGQAEALKKDVRTTIVNSPAKGAYPICGFTYVLVSKAPKDAAKGKALNDFLLWAIKDGQALIVPLQYAPLPTDLVTINEQALSQVQTGSK
ncbi:MAG: phosphate transport system substrate-binding protein [Fimbriimonadaceae bacterium]|jgi:phosphate transport system substrate-binding protein|nr:phosphate transport system substrate-binding protein [Fimbriimonadaceae bacterium]